MDRVVKFRGKRLDNGEWTPGNLIRIEDRCAMVGYTDLDDAFEVGPATVGQFTGLHDKNGREIYEGDTLRAEWSLASGSSHLDIQKSFFAEVVWVYNYGGFMMRETGAAGCDYTYRCIGDFIVEII